MLLTNSFGNDWGIPGISLKEESQGRPILKPIGSQVFLRAVLYRMKKPTSRFWNRCAGMRPKRWHSAGVVRSNCPTRWNEKPSIEMDQTLLIMWLDQRAFP